MNGAGDADVQAISDAYDELASIYGRQEALLAAEPVDVASLIEAGRRAQELLRRIGARPRLAPASPESWAELSARAEALRRRGAALADRCAAVAAAQRAQASRIGRGGGRLQAYISSERTAPGRYIDQDR